MDFVQEKARITQDNSEGSETTNLFPWSRSTNDQSSAELKDWESSKGVVESEHMFDKVVTPSDVGKLNRLVIPKQHAQKHFPLDSSAADKGLLLNFEDRDGKSWRFRYSYWNSSQSYVMTKGWSRFVKDKKLDAGDIVSFHRGRGALARDRLFIDWRRRPQTPLNSLRARLFSPPPLHYLNYTYNYNLVPHHHYQGMNLGYYIRPSSSSSPAVQHSDRHVIDSIPLLQGRSAAAGKRLRLFGVNMECGMSKDDQPTDRMLLPSTALLPHVSVSEKGKSPLSFDLDL